MRIAMAKCVGFLTRSEALLADALTAFARRHSDDPELRNGARVLAAWSQAHLEALRPVASTNGESLEAEAASASAAMAPVPPIGEGGLTRDLQSLVLLAENVQASWLALSRSAAALGEPELRRTCDVLGAESDRQLAWLRAQLRAHDPRAATPDVLELDDSGPRGLTPEPAPESSWGALAAGAISLCIGALAWLALGGLRTGRDVAHLAVGLVLMAVAGLVHRRVRRGSFTAAASGGPRVKAAGWRPQAGNAAAPSL